MGNMYGFEERQFKLSDGTQYRPDFFIYEDGMLTKVVEIKGFWDNRSYKCALLREEYNIDVILVYSVDPYIDGSYKKLLEEWKMYIRKMKKVQGKS